MAVLIAGRSLISSRKGLFWPIIMIVCIVIVSAALIGSYYYFNIMGERVKQRISGVDVMPESAQFLPLLLEKRVQDVPLGIIIAHAQVSEDFTVVQREIEEYLFARFGRSVKYIFLVDGVERASSGYFVEGKRFYAFVPVLAPDGEEKGIVKVELEVDDSAWKNEIHAPFMEGLV